jgi:hypothetical protein
MRGLDCRRRTRGMTRAGACSNEAKRCRRLPYQHGDTTCRDVSNPMGRLSRGSSLPTALRSSSCGQPVAHLRSPCRGPVLGQSPGDEVLSGGDVAASQRWRSNCRTSFVTQLERATHWNPGGDALGRKTARSRVMPSWILLALAALSICMREPISGARPGLPGLQGPMPATGPGAISGLRLG